MRGSRGRSFGGNAAFIVHALVSHVLLQGEAQKQLDVVAGPPMLCVLYS